MIKSPEKEKHSSKTLKGQLFGAISMMLVAAIALGTSTYAWFVNNSTVAVDPMQLTVTSSQYLQIAVKTKTAAAGPEGTEYTAYKNLITNADIINASDDATAPGAGWTNMLSAEAAYQMVPASTVTAVTDNSFFSSLGGMEGTKLSTFAAMPTLGERGNEGGVKKMVFSFKSSTDTDVYLGGMKDADNGYASLDEFLTDVAGGDVGKAAAIAKDLRMAIVPAGGDSVIFQFNDTKATPVEGNTLYPTSEADAVTNDDSTGTYRAIATVAADTHLIETTGEQKAVLSTGKTSDNAKDYIAAVAKNAAGGAPDVNVENKTALFSLTANTPKDVAVYFWLEGVDGDCTVDLATLDFNIALPFAAGTTPAAP